MQYSLRTRWVFLLLYLIYFCTRTIYTFHEINVEIFVRFFQSLIIEVISLNDCDDDDDDEVKELKSSHSDIKLVIAMLKIQVTVVQMTT